MVDLRGELQSYCAVLPCNRVVGTYDNQYLENCRLLVSTKKGFLVLANGEMRLLLDGQFFGISQLDDAWYVFQRLSCWSGRIIRFTLSSEGMVDAMQVITRISPGCHQIDFLGRTLYITDTYNNRLLVYEQSGRRWNRISEHFPGGRLDRGRDSANYAHMNSIWRSDDGIWLMFHNETKKTGRNSELICVDSNHDVIERLSTNASNSHNLVRLDGRFLYCDSLRGALVHGDEIVNQVGCDRQLGCRRAIAIWSQGEA